MKRNTSGHKWQRGTDFGNNFWKFKVHEFEVKGLKP